jgi:dCMP deaminase
VILGVSGTNGAGKGELIEFLRARSFYPLSLSDVLREELKLRGESETRERMIAIGNELRGRLGSGALAEKVCTRLTIDRNWAIDSIRHPAEVEALRKHAGKGGFKLIWVDADAALRFERLRSRGRPGDPTSLDKLLEQEGRERGGQGDSAQQLDAVAALADFRVRNEGSLQALYAEVQKILEASGGFARPNWDEYFLQVVKVVASRSNCVKRHVGAVIQRDRRIVSTGYNGTPRGTRNCNEGGCPRCNSFAESGTRLDECLCSHGEENAITQAAYHGVSVRGATLYTTFFPCLFCTKLIINAGIEEVVYGTTYHLEDVARGLLEQAGVRVRQVEVEAR